MQEHHRKVYNVLRLLSEFGGLFTVISNFFAIIGVFINSRVHSANILSEMYYLKLSKKKDPNAGMWKNPKQFTPNLNQFMFSMTDQFTEVK